MEDVQPESIVERRPANEVVVATDARIEQLQATYFFMVELNILLGDPDRAARCETDANQLYVTHRPKSLKAEKMESAPKGLIARFLGGATQKRRTYASGCREKWSGLLDQMK